MLGLPATYWYLWAGALINRLGGFVFTFLSLYLTQGRGLTVEQAGFIVSLYGAGSIFSGPAGGALADRLGRRPTMMLAMGLAAAAMLQLGLARTTAHIALSTLLYGFFSDLYRPAVQATVADVVPPAERPRAFGYLYWAVNLGFSAAAAMAGLLLQRGYLLLFLADAATTLLFAVLVFLRVPETRPAGAHASGAAGLLVPYRDGVFLAFVLVQFLVALVFNQGFVTLPVDLRGHGVSPGTYGRLIGINGVLIVLLQPLVASRQRRLGEVRALCAGTLLLGLGLGLNGLARTVPGYALSIVVWTLGEILFMPVAPAVIAELAPLHLRGSYQGAFQIAWGASTFAAPIVGMQVLGHLGSRALWGGCCAGGVLCALLHLLIAGPRRRRYAAQPCHPAPARL